MKHQLGLTTVLIALGLVATLSQAADLGYRVVEKLPLSREVFTQGLEIHGDQLYISSGGWGRAFLQRYPLRKNGDKTTVALSPSLFAEGLTVVGPRIYQLTWKSGFGAVYRRDNLQQLAWFRIPGQGWGLCYNGDSLIYGDGSNRLFFLSPDTLQKTREIAVTENGVPVAELNELEWINDRIWANVWRTNRLVVIDPQTGNVAAGIDLSGLLTPEERRDNTDVLNGIAYDRQRDQIWVTGKRWPWLYRIEIIGEIP